MEDEHKIILMTGGPGNGFDFYGPFEDEDAAINFAETKGFEDPWWLVNLRSPTNG